MRNITKSELHLILKEHKEWVSTGYSKGKRADLYGANLSGANLSGANLSCANLCGANLYGANLCGANLSRADLSGANLSRADLYGANLYGANLSRADLYGANLSRADLYGANLSRADLYGANLSCANLSGIKNMPSFQCVPELGPFYAFKKLKGGVIATLYIPRSAGRVSSTSRKSRVSRAKVMALSTGTEAVDSHTGKLLYKVGRWVKPDSFNGDFRETCTNGIHCFITKQEAIDY